MLGLLLASFATEAQPPAKLYRIGGLTAAAGPSSELKEQH
jgi:hypothetical protein